VDGKWYGNPDTYAARNEDSGPAAILWASRNPKSVEAEMYSERYPPSNQFIPGPPPGYTVSSPNKPEQSWAQVTGKKGRGKKPATAAQVAAYSKDRAPKAPPTLPAAQRRFYAPRLTPALPDDTFRMTATLPDIMAGVLKQA
jgi:hypothetical protein